jgi:hypothetical protein
MQDGPAAKKTKPTEQQYEGVLRSQEEYKRHLYNDWWAFDIVFSGPNEEYVIESNPIFTAFDQNQPWGDLDNPIIPLFARRNLLLAGFVQDPDLLWARMDAAVKMASLFLTVPLVAGAYLR